jgi:hypothetical protein
VEGPMGFKWIVGVVTEGFEEIGSMITVQLFRTYKEHFEQLGFKEKEYLENKFRLKM